jgi:type II secretory pathway component PulJ
VCCPPERHGGFTLAEVLAALAFLAIVIPVAVEGLRVASRAGQVGQRKAVATRVAQRVLNEFIVSASQVGGMSRGAVEEDSQTYAWTLSNEPWPEDTMRVVTAEVIYTVQGQELSVRLSTLNASGSL